MRGAMRLKVVSTYRRWSFIRSDDNTRTACADNGATLAALEAALKQYSHLLAIQHQCHASREAILVEDEEIHAPLFCSNKITGSLEAAIC
ncbi:hypothetical protein J7373_15865 [Xanthomonas sp. A2111]|uniref:Uncharacterized protein n=1 Tax=Xanthomonas hawaiiensis TaxID=3003247 RepID=A0ABU2I5L6_9XANT|nr:MULTISPECIES: hypothetical protein [unclassified Xanthomonas]MBO9829730.1 hypothetical protein [Xanthomonas sp. A2111]MBO9873369.1 hypothetical protein [Xanthomonas sp. D-93]MDS9993422.1 hypothetical protein [Xanthomonas sp. A2111]WNH45157.1 hypothetical protein PG878_01400 [Xanthomonas sp. A6251]